MMSATNNTPTPGDSARVSAQPAPGTDLGVLETLAELPVSEHLAIYEQLHDRLSADLGSTSQEQR